MCTEEKTKMADKDIEKVTVESVKHSTLHVFTNYAISSFPQFSLLSVLQVVHGVINIVIKPPLAKLADALGRLEAMLITIVSMTVGMILLAASPNIGAYFAGQLF